MTTKGISTLCPRCGTPLVENATPAELTSTPGRLDRIDCPNPDCAYWARQDPAPVMVERFNTAAELPDKLPPTLAGSVEQIAVSAMAADAAVKKGEADPAAIVEWATGLAQIAAQLAAVCRAEVLLTSGAADAAGDTPNPLAPHSIARLVTPIDSAEAAARAAHFEAQRKAAELPLDVHVAVGPEAIDEAPAPLPPPLDRIAEVIAQITEAAGEIYRETVTEKASVEASITWARKASKLTAKLANELYRGMP